MSRFDVRWIGHATVEVAVGGLRLLTDPVVTSTVAHLRRRVAAPPPLTPDVVLISHLHLDHLHQRSLRRVLGSAPNGTALVVPRGAAPLVRWLAAPSVIEVTAGDTLTFDAPDGTTVHVEVTAARHSCRRGPHSTANAHPVGFVVRGAGRAAYFAGDTDLFPGMAGLVDVDVALLPIWGWGPTLGAGHLDPDRAAEATAWIGPRAVVPIHWGTYSPIRAGVGAPPWFGEPLAAFRAALAERRLTDRLHVLRPGDTLRA